MAETVTYDDQRERYYVDVTLDEPDSVANGVVYALADILDEDPLTLPPLGETVDTDALTKIFDTVGGATSNVMVSFEYCGFDVEATQGGRVTFEALG